MKRYNLSRNDSLARSNREIELPQNFQGMSLDRYYISLGESLKKDLENHLITSSQFREKLTVLKNQYRVLKTLGIQD